MEIEQLKLILETLQGVGHEAGNLAVEAMFQQIKPIIEGNDSNVVLDTLLITLAACGGQLDMPPEHFKAFVIVQLDRLMLVNAKPEGTA